MNLIILLFALAAVGGVTMLLMHLQSKGIPMALAVGHGLLAAIALVLLVLAVTGGNAGGYSSIALVLFVVAALGGFVLFAAQLKNKPLSTPLIIVHGGVAVVGFVLLLLSIL
jgi:hypothetical protein